MLYEVITEYKLKMSKEKIIDTAIESIEYIKEHGILVEFSAEDATRTELDYLKEVYEKAVEAGADRINVPDTVGVMVPHSRITSYNVCYTKLLRLKNNSKVVLWKI